MEADRMSNNSNSDDRPVRQTGAIAAALLLLMDGLDRGEGKRFARRLLERLVEDDAGLDPGRPESSRVPAQT
jgi:hypothetical protein